MLLAECPRDAMQGWREFIPTQQKIDYLNALMQVGFDVLDCGSFVSPKLIPQMADTSTVLENIDKSAAKTKVSVIIANLKGAERALEHSKVDVLGFPFSISETFQFRNTNKRQEEAFSQIIQILQDTQRAGKGLRVYLSMAFGNPYGELWKSEDIYFWVERLSEIGVQEILLSDTIGVATNESIRLVFSRIINAFPSIVFGAHFHTKYEESYTKLKAAYNQGCRSFDTAIKGFGGCPMAKDQLVGNMPTEQMINFLMREKIEHKLNLLNFEAAYNKAKDIFHF
ncbi:hydroxymethylglutaryl-CoA lyase [Bergeyella cardium]|uniref:Hydroxymethylglutaryl-CoA lyase n=1 Tax=Bergeyella cardium TaxID=1585976 RepID=A0A6P1QW74_9FLAO|nr:hydroxymethylglutaryl-CoA lyase [Bergeyella cardium]QHN65020.1 hydroxymethylglutaryl-CoA lyase [Bergeyella cardium]WHE34335.1 hydroxymethylglutaryl-CoA lyase [Bergeyella cardium]WHF60986.1 hydroxymethylglutaryl-CoA lyase [Bergeyella cardium]